MVLNIYIFVYISYICLYISIYFYMFLYISYMSIYFYIFLYVSICFYIFLYIYIYIYFYFYMFLYIYILLFGVAVCFLCFVAVFYACVGRRLAVGPWQWPWPWLSPPHPRTNSYDPQGGLMLCISKNV